MKFKMLLAAGAAVVPVIFAHPVWAADALATAKAEYREVAQTYSVEGVVEAVRQSTVSAQISGRIKEINFDVPIVVFYRKNAKESRL